MDTKNDTMSQDNELVETSERAPKKGEFSTCFLFYRFATCGADRYYLEQGNTINKSIMLYGIAGAAEQFY